MMGNDYITVFRYFTDESYFLQPLCKAWQKTFVNKAGRAVGSTRTSKAHHSMIPCRHPRDAIRPYWLLFRPPGCGDASEYSASQNVRCINKALFKGIFMSQETATTETFGWVVYNQDLFHTVAAIE